MRIIIDEFIESLKARQASQNTLSSYERDIVQFSNYFEEQGKKVFDLTNEDMQEYINHLLAQGKSNSTISRSTASIKAFYRYLVSKKLAESNIAESVDSPKVDRKDPLILTKEERTSEIEKMILKSFNQMIQGKNSDFYEYPTIFKCFLVRFFHWF